MLVEGMATVKINAVIVATVGEAAATTRARLLLHSTAEGSRWICSLLTSAPMRIQCSGVGCLSL